MGYVSCEAKGLAYKFARFWALPWKLLGRPKGALGTSRLDGKEQDIRALLGKDVSKASIAKILDVSRSALYHFIQTRKIAPG